MASAVTRQFRYGEAHPPLPYAFFRPTPETITIEDERETGEYENAREWINWSCFLQPMAIRDEASRATTIDDLTAVFYEIMASMHILAGPYGGAGVVDPFEYKSVIISPTRVARAKLVYLGDAKPLPIDDD